MATIQDYFNKLSQAERLHKANWVNPYSNAYITAHKQFKGMISAQANQDKLLADAALMEISLGVGAGMSALFASAGVASAKELFLNGAIDVVCNHNMNRTFDFMYKVSESPAASYLAGNAWKLVESKLTAKAKKGVTSLLTRQQIATNAIKDPLQSKNDMERYVYLAIAAAHSLGDELKANSSLSSSQRSKIVDELMRAPLILEAPLSNRVPQNAALILELNMWMSLIMNRDVSNSISGTRSRWWTQYSIESTRPSATPLGQGYPAPYNNSCGETVDERSISVSLGSHVWARIDYVHNQIFGKPFKSRPDANYPHTGPASREGGYAEVVSAAKMSWRLQARLDSSMAPSPPEPRCSPHGSVPTR